MLGEALGAIGGAALGALGNIGGSAANSAMGWYFSKKAAALNYKYQERLAKNQPSWNVAGLEKAGLNPILATNAPHSGGLNVASPVGGDSKLGASALEGAGAAANIANVLADKKKKDAEADAIKTQAKAAERTSKAAEWQIWDNKALREGGVKAWIDIGGKMHEVNTIRINKVTGQAFTIDGQKIARMTYTDIPSSAKQAQSPIYQMIRVDGSGINSSMNAPSMTIPVDGMKIQPLNLK